MTEHSIPASATLARFTVQEFETMIDAGVFANHPRVELHEGVLVEMNSEYLPHARCKFQLARHLADAIDALGRIDLEVLTDVSISLSDASSTTPDVSVWRSDASSKLLPADRALLVVEVAATTLAVDLGYKVRRYAESGIAEYLVVDLAAGVLHRHARPAGGQFGDVEQVSMGASVTADIVPGLSILLPKY